MPVKVSKRRGKFRIVEADTGRIVKTSKGRARDGGGHKDRERAQRQATAINTSLAKKRK